MKDLKNLVPGDVVKLDSKLNGALPGLIGNSVQFTCYPGQKNNRYAVQIMNMHKTLDDESDVIFHGHGFDYMFQGMYLPRKHYCLLGRSLYYSRIKTPPEPMDEYFINNVSYGIINHNYEDLCNFSIF